ncbi:hypothetical protein ACFLZY_02025 [Patescibacteria group bacterium]
MYDSRENTEVLEETSDEVSQIQVDSGSLEPDTDSQKSKHEQGHCCDLCGESRQAKYRYRENEMICYLCYYNKVVGKQACAICTEVKIVPYRDQNKKRICAVCYRRHVCPKRKCCLCGKKDITKLFIEEGPVCEQCYKEFVPKEKCVRCGSTRRVCARDEQGQPFCEGCRKPELPGIVSQPPAVGGDMTPEHEKNAYDRLVAVMHNIGGEIEEVFNEVVEMARQGREAATRIAATQAALEKVRELVNDQPSFTFKEVPVAQAIKKRTKKKTGTKKVKSDKGPKLDPDLVLLCKIELIKARAQGERVFVAKRFEVVKTLGLERRRNRYRRIGTMFARTQGKARSGFIKSLLVAMPDAKDDGLLNELAEAYTQIDGVEITVNDLLKEVV